MQVIVLSIHLLVCICLIGLVLLQRSEGGALGIGGGGSGALMSGRGASDALAKLTSIAGGLFLVVSLALTWLSGAGQSSDRSVFDNILPQQAPITAPLTPAPAPTAPAEEPAATPDPTQSAAPAPSQMASILPGPAPAAAATPAPAGPRAAPLESRPAATTPAQRPAATPPAQRPATNQQASAQQPARTPAPARTTPAPARTTTPPLQIPNTSGAATGLTSEPSGSESVTVGNGMEAVRRERAGPDQ
jgi:preprotein translocase subunit SecG